MSDETGVVYQNKLEAWYQQASWPVQKVLSIGNVYNKVNGALKSVAGKPEELDAAGSKYLDLGTRMGGMQGEIEQIVAMVTTWEGAGHDSFVEKAQQLAQSLGTLAEAVGRTDEVLKSAAKAAVECANAIFDIAKAFIKFLIQSLAAALASSTFTFGASVGAWIAANVAKGVQLIMKVLKLGEKFVKIMNTIIKLFKKIMEIYQKVKKILDIIVQLFNMVKGLANGQGIDIPQAVGLVKDIGTSVLGTKGEDGKRTGGILTDVGDLGRIWKGQEPINSGSSTGALGSGGGDGGGSPTPMPTDGGSHEGEGLEDETDPDGNDGKAAEGGAGPTASSTGRAGGGTGVGNILTGIGHVLGGGDKGDQGGRGIGGTISDIGRVLGGKDPGSGSSGGEGAVDGAAAASGGKAKFPTKEVLDAAASTYSAIQSANETKKIAQGIEIPTFEKAPTKF